MLYLIRGFFENDYCEICVAISLQLVEDLCDALVLLNVCYEYGRPTSVSICRDRGRCSQNREQLEMTACMVIGRQRSELVLLRGPFKRRRTYQEIRSELFSYAGRYECRLEQQVEVVHFRHCGGDRGRG